MHLGLKNIICSNLRYCDLVDELNEWYEGFGRMRREGLISAISAGFFFLLVGAIFIITPNLFQRILDFFNDFTRLVPVPNTTQIFVPAPDHPLGHRVVYQAAEQFEFALGLFQFVILALRLVMSSPLRRITETVSHLIFWLGAGYLTLTLLLEPTTYRSAMVTWFAFWAAIIMLLGTSFIVRAIILAAASATRMT
jgi:hypothetical protein